MPDDVIDTQAANNVQGQKSNLRWSRYAPFYDDMCAFIPAYQENIDALIDALPSLGLPPNPKILDLGGGTGNYVLAMSKVLPDATFIHLDLDPVMNAAASEKYARHSVDATVVQGDIQEVDFDMASFDLIVCVNALGHASYQVPVLRRMSKWLKPTAKLFLISFGRPLRLFDWTLYIFRSATKTIGVFGFLIWFYKNRQLLFQNSRAKKDQKAGTMWLHTSEEFREVIEKGSFQIIQSRVCYRGYSDMAICKPKLLTDEPMQ